MPGGSVYSYDSNNVSVIACSIPIVGGWGEDDFCTVSQDSDDYTDIVSVDGDVIVSATNDLRADIKLVLHQMSPCNTLLAALRTIGGPGTNMAGAGVFQLRDGNGTLVHFAEKCWIRKPPEIVYGKTAKGLEWTLRVGRLQRFDGGV